MKKSLSILVFASLFLVACTVKHSNKSKVEESTVTETQTPVDTEAYKAQQEAAAQAYVDVETKAIEAGDADACNDIPDQNQMYSCRYQIIVNQAIKAKDPSLCNEIGNTDQEDICKQNSQI